MAKRIWAASAVRGVLFLLVGLLMALWPDLALGLIKWLLVILLAGHAAVLAIEGTQRLGDDDNAGAVIRYALGAVAVVAAIALLVWPGSTIKVVLTLVAIWALVSGALGTAAAVRGRGQGKPSWDWELVIALLSMVFGLVVLVNPLDTLAAVTAGLSVFLTVSGIVLLVAALSVATARKQAQAVEPAGPVTAPPGIPDAVGDLPTAPTPAVGDVANRTRR